MLRKKNAPARLTGSALRLAIRGAIAKHLDLETYEIFIFGSEALGDGTQRSDIDVGVRGPRPVSKAKLVRIREELEKLPTLRMFDVVDFTAADPAFANVALEKIVKI